MVQVRYIRHILRLHQQDVTPTGQPVFQDLIKFDISITGQRLSDFEA